MAQDVPAGRTPNVLTFPAVRPGGLSALIDPLLNHYDLRVTQRALLVRHPRYFRVSALYRLNDQAACSVTRLEGRTRFPALERARRRIQPQTPLMLQRAVAATAVLCEDGFHVADIIHRRRDSYQCEDQSWCHVTEMPIQCELCAFPSPGLRPPSPHPMGRGQGEGRCCFQLARRHCKEALLTPLYDACAGSDHVAISSQPRGEW